MTSRDPSPSEAVVLTFRVVPNASRSEIVGWDAQGDIRLRLKSPAVEGKANAEAIAFLSKTAGLRKNLVTIVRGEKARKKWIAFQSIGRTDLLHALGLSG